MTVMTPTNALSTTTGTALLDDVVAMVNALPEPAATLIATAAFSGLRRSEIMGLRWEDLDGDELTVRRSAWRPTAVVEATKTKASRARIPVISVLAQYLESHRNGFPPDGFIFQGPVSQKPLDLHNLTNRVILPKLREAKIEWCGWHGFRRGLATNLKALDVKPEIAKDILRHANISVTMDIYAQPVAAKSKAAMKKMEKVFQEKLKAAKAKRKAK
jgi:integrase